MSIFFYVIERVITNKNIFYINCFIHCLLPTTTIKWKLFEFVSNFITIFWVLTLAHRNVGFVFQRHPSFSKVRSCCCLPCWPLSFDFWWGISCDMFQRPTCPWFADGANLILLEVCKDLCVICDCYFFLLELQMEWSRDRKSVV